MVENQGQDAELADVLMQLSFVLQAAVARVGAVSGLSATQVRMLAILEDRQIGMAELAKLLELEKSSVTGLVDRAEKRGLVVRRRPEGDRRGIHVVLTDEAREIVEAFRADMQKSITRLAEPLGQRGREQMVASTRLILEGYRQWRNAGWEN